MKDVPSGKYCETDTEVCMYLNFDTEEYGTGRPWCMKYYGKRKPMEILLRFKRGASKSINDILKCSACLKADKRGGKNGK